MFINTVSIRKDGQNRAQFRVKYGPDVYSVTDIQEGSYIVKGKSGI